MCGIIGFISAEPKAVDDLGPLFSQLLLFDQVRGWDSTGAFVLDGSFNPIIYKRGVDASTFIGSDNYENLIFKELPTAYAAIGHNRAATKGDINDRNAHPFEYRGIVAVHNGNISNANALLPGSETVAVDSMVIPRIIHEKGEIQALEAFRGAFALAWYNPTDQTINLARNGERTLSYCAIEGKNVIAFASEYRMLDLALHRVGMKPEGNYRIPQPGTLYKFSIANPKAEPALSPFQLAPKTTHRVALGGGLNTSGLQSQGTTLATTGDGTTASTRGLLPGSSEADHQLGLYLRLANLLDPKVRKKECWAFGKKELRRAWTKTNSMGVRLGERVLGHFDTFQSYGKSQKNGKLIGQVWPGNRTYVAELPNITEEDANKLLGMGNIWLRVVNARTRMDNVSALIVTLGLETREKLEGRATVAQTERRFVPGPDSRLVSVAAYLALTTKGCQMCSMPLTTADAPKLTWVKNNPICADCASDQDKMSSIGLMSADTTNLH